MARIGLSHPHMAEIDTENATGLPTYKQGKEIAWAVTADVTIDGGDPVVLYANNAIRESDTGFTGGTIALEVDDISLEIYAEMLGHQTITEGATEVIRSSANDTPPYFGFGYIVHKKVGGVYSFETRWYYKTQFSEPQDSSKTKGEKTEFATDTINGKIMALTNSVWRDTNKFDTFEDAYEWLNTKANVATGG